MQQVDSIQRVSKVAAVFNRVVQLFAGARLSTPRPDLAMANVDWPDSDSGHSNGERDNRPVSGGYKEAFIVQYWTSYHLS